MKEEIQNPFTDRNCFFCGSDNSSGPKLKWVLDNIPDAKKDIFSGDVLFGTIETWIIWWLTGGPDKGSDITDVSNASRTMMMNIHSLEWDKDLVDALSSKKREALYSRWGKAIERSFDWL